MASITYFNGLTFNLFGIVHSGKGRAFHHPPFYSLEYIHTGYLNLSVNHGPCHRLQGPFAFFTDPHYFYDYYSPEGTERHHYYVCFTGERAERYRTGGLLAVDLDRPYFPILEPEVFLKGMLNLILSLQNHANQAKSVADLEQMMLSVHEQKKPQISQESFRNSLDTLVEDIMLDPNQPWDFRQEAALLKVSPRRFHDLFRSTYGIPPQRFLLHQRMYKAMEMLKQGQDTVKSIAFACGFNNEFYFSRLFKKYFHLSPSDYRASLP